MAQPALTGFGRGAGTPWQGSRVSGAAVRCGGTGGGSAPACRERSCPGWGMPAPCRGWGLGSPLQKSWRQWELLLQHDSLCGLSCLSCVTVAGYPFQLKNVFWSQSGALAKECVTCQAPAQSDSLWLGRGAWFLFRFPDSLIVLLTLKSF